MDAPPRGVTGAETVRKVARAAWRRRWAIAGWAAVVVFLGMVGRYRHPFYGFTRLLQIDASSAGIGIREIREQPVYVYDEAGGYDGLSYAQLAFHPGLDSSELEGALDSAPYRSRRILGSALAWLAVGGRPAYIADAYAMLNIAVWLVLAAILWSLLRVADARSFVAWAGVLFSAGALHSVRLALTDLLALTVIAGAMWLHARGRRGTALGVLGVAALARETALLAVVSRFPAQEGRWRDPRALAKFAIAAVVVVVPFAVWSAYVWMRFGSSVPGWGNFGWPLLGWLGKWRELFATLATPEHRWLAVTSLLALVAMSAQALFFVVKRRPGDPWWRIGAVFAVMMLFLGTAVWEGHPGAATRVLLPMSLAFAVVAVRERASWAWLVVAGLGLFAGFEPFRVVAENRYELAAGRAQGVAWVAEMDRGFFGRESHRGHVWSWSGGRGRLSFRTTATESGALKARMRVRALDARELEVRGLDGALVWRGPIDTEWKPLELPVPVGADGHGWLEFSTAEPGVPESAAADARALAFGLVDVTLEQ